jgi:hypothetical protein
MRVTPHHGDLNGIAAQRLPRIMKRTGTQRNGNWTQIDRVLKQFGQHKIQFYLAENGLPMLQNERA